MRVYLAGPLFTKAERDYLESLAARIRGLDIECFVPHLESRGLAEQTPAGVFEKDYGKGLLAANAVVAWLDGPIVDDGTACEVGVFYGLMQQGEPWRKGILGLATDLRLQRRRPYLGSGGINLFVSGVIEAAGRVCWSEEEVLAGLRVWKDELAGSVQAG